MTLAEAERHLASRPVAFTVVGGCVLVADALTPHAPLVARHLESCGGDEARVESLVNRRFVVAHMLDELLDRPPGVFAMTAEFHAAIGRVAEAYAERLRESLRREFPERAFEVETVGTDDIAEEPLEVCVTFSRVRPDVTAGRRRKKKRRR